MVRKSLKSKSSELARWDKGVLKKMRLLLPGTTDAERSRSLFKTSLFGAESGLRSLDNEIFKPQRKMNKKGSLLDIVYAIGVLFFFAFLLLIGFKISGEFNTQAQSLNDLSASEKATIDTLNSRYTGVMDKSIVFLAIGISLVTLILAALVRVHPIFIPLFIVGLLFVVVIAAVASNVYEEVATHPGLVNEADQLPLTSLILNYLPIFVAVVGTLLMIVMYKTWSAEQ